MTRFLARLLIVLLTCAAAALASQPAVAQMLGKSGSAIVDEQRVVIEGLTFRTNELEKKIEVNAEDDARLVEIRLSLEEIARELINSSVSFRPRLTEINDRLGVIGAAAPADGTTEPDVVAAEREGLLAEKSEINAALGVAEELSIRVNSLIVQITEIRRNLFSQLLTKRYDINFTLGGEVVDAAKAAWSTFYRSVAAWLRFVVNFKLGSVLAATFFALAAAAILLIGGRRLLGHLFDPDPEMVEPSYLSRLSIAFWSTLLPTAAFAVFLGATFFLFNYFQVLRGDIGVMLAALFSVLGLVFFVHRLGVAILAPRLPEWRLIPVRSEAASMLLWIMSTTAALSGLDFLLTRVNAAINAPVILTVAEALAATVLIGLLVILAGLVKPFVDAEGRPRRWRPILRYLVYLMGIATIGAALLGYIGLARFFSQQIVWTGAVLATMYIGFLSSRAVSEEGAFASTAIGRRAQAVLHLDDATLDQLALVASIFINLLVVIIGLPMILFQWGFQPGDIYAWVYRVATGIQIGSFTLSLTGIFWGVLVFVVGYVVTRWFQGWLDDSVMARGRVDTGVRNSIRTVVGYAGLALAGLVGLSAAGIDFSNLALIAGGLSLGIGFGLQNVVSNFVSGLILLAERPFKSGDWIVAGAVTGTVKKISVRATEIETFQRQTVILPNSELINGAVGNWTHRNKLGRVEIQVAVPYEADAQKIHGLLRELARSHPLVLMNPEPAVAFTAFGEYALNFEIRVFLADINNGGLVQTELRFAILELFKREGIEIPHKRDYGPKPRPTTDEPAALPSWPADDDKAEAELVEAVHMENQKKPRRRAARSSRPPRRRRPDPV
ncbi:MAG: mechanosensitive ion channel family protein [Rhizobiaceae bacterium]|nr:mechanosensitive ion channel family protein [Rhizobiaceae bacterium]